MLRDGIPQDAFLLGENVYLRALRDEDAEGPYGGWFNDEEVCLGNSHHVFPYTKEAALEFIRAVHKRRDCLVLAIAGRADNRHIGNISLQNIDPVHRAAEFAILIGDRASWGKGFGKEAGKLLVAHGFRALNLHRIHCGTLATNVGMQHLARHLGMREEGRRREAAFKNGRFVDVLEYGVLENELDGHGSAGSAGR